MMLFYSTNKGIMRLKNSLKQGMLLIAKIYGGLKYE